MKRFYFLLAVFVLSLSGAFAEARIPAVGRTVTATARITPLAGLVTDSFNRADTSSGVGPGTADTGQVWEEDGIAATHWGILSDQLIFPTGQGQQDTTVVIDAKASDATVSITNRQSNANGWGLVARQTDNLNYDLLNVTLPGNGLNLYTKIAGAYTVIAGPSAYPSNVNGDILKLMVSGTTVTGYLNGLQILTATNSLNQTTTRYGVRGFDPPVLDNFQVTSP